MTGLRWVELKRTSRVAQAQVGMLFEERFVIHNASSFPKFWIEVRDNSSLPFARGSHVITILKKGEKQIFYSRSILSQRGVFRLGPTKLISRDMLGLFCRQRTVPAQQTLVVLPIMFEVRNFPNNLGRLPGGEALRKRTEQITSNVSGVRDYFPGDPLNRIHWLSTARRNRLISKEFELDPLSDVWIFIDAQSSVHIKQPFHQVIDIFDYWKRNIQYHLPPSTEEYAVSIGASLTRYYINGGRAVGVAYFDQRLRVLVPDRSIRQLKKILRILAIFHATGSVPIEQVVEIQSRQLSRGSTVVIITPNNTKAILKTVDSLMRRSLSPIVILIDSSSFDESIEIDNIAPYLDIQKVPFRLIKKDAVLSEVIAGIDARASATVN